MGGHLTTVIQGMYPAGYTYCAFLVVSIHKGLQYEPEQTITLRPLALQWRLPRRGSVFVERTFLSC